MSDLEPIDLPRLPIHRLDAPEGVIIDITTHGAVGDGKGLMTTAIQATIDACAAAGGGVVMIPPGTFRTGGLRLRSRITLRFAAGAMLLGSDDLRDYGTGAWNEALLTAADADEIRIEGPGIIDGADCFNPKGEGGVRGPHGFWLERCRDVIVREVTFRNIGNWGIAAWRSTDLTFDRFRVLAGHDGIDIGNCHRVRIIHCDFRTGDDCIAGAGNRDVTMTDTRFNSACNALRVGIERLHVARCQVIGPGEYVHRFGSNRSNLLAAFVHFSPIDRDYRGPTPHSDQWLIEDTTVDGADTLLEYDGAHSWQIGRGFGTVVFRRVRVTGFITPITAIAVTHRDDGYQPTFKLIMEDVELTPRAGREDVGFFDLRRHRHLALRRVTLHRNGSSVPIRAMDGGQVEVSGLIVEPVGSGASTQQALNGVGVNWFRESAAATADADPDISMFAREIAGTQYDRNFTDGPVRGQWRIAPHQSDVLIIWSRRPAQVRVRGRISDIIPAGRAALTEPATPAEPARHESTVDVDRRRFILGADPVLIRGIGIELVVD